jgi:hypothetical protein
MKGKLIRSHSVLGGRPPEYFYVHCSKLKANFAKTEGILCQYTGIRCSFLTVHVLLSSKHENSVSTLSKIA